MADDFQDMFGQAHLLSHGRRTLVTCLHRTMSRLASEVEFRAFFTELRNTHSDLSGVRMLLNGAAHADNLNVHEAKWDKKVPGQALLTVVRERLYQVDNGLSIDTQQLPAELAKYLNRHRLPAQPSLSDMYAVGNKCWTPKSSMQLRITRWFDDNFAAPRQYQPLQRSQFLNAVAESLESGPLQTSFQRALHSTIIGTDVLIAFLGILGGIAVPPIIGGACHLSLNVIDDQVILSILLTSELGDHTRPPRSFSAPILETGLRPSDVFIDPQAQLQYVYPSARRHFVPQSFSSVRTHGRDLRLTVGFSYTQMLFTVLQMLHEAMYRPGLFQNPPPGAPLCHQWAAALINRTQIPVDESQIGLELDDA